ncbi:MAG: hypothetical protein KME21_12160 [Desmonostoc vinosum HA7617-LM4]|nr:hypothetical protein [Desmonostoc vinosum HA7617-LM4]
MKRISKFGRWSEVGTGDWGLGTGDWGRRGERGSEGVREKISPRLRVSPSPRLRVPNTSYHSIEIAFA